MENGTLNAGQEEMLIFFLFLPYSRLNNDQNENLLNGNFDNVQGLICLLLTIFRLEYFNFDHFYALNSTCKRYEMPKT